MDYQHLSTLLWREQELLDLLLFKAEEKQYLIVTGKSRWLARIAHEIEVVLDQLRTLEVERAAVTETLAVQLGLDANPSLRQVADAAPGGRGRGVGAAAGWRRPRGGRPAARPPRPAPPRACGGGGGRPGCCGLSAPASGSCPTGGGTPSPRP